MKPVLLLILGFDEYWLVPVAGVAVCGFALLLGWRFAAGRPRSRASAEDGIFDASFLKGVTQERRAATRRKGNTVEVQLSGTHGTTIRGWVLDRSQGGLGLLVEQVVAEGTPLKVRPCNAMATVPWIDVTVRSCRGEASQYELGCQFVRLPSWNELLHFG